MDENKKELLELFYNNVRVNGDKVVIVQDKVEWTYKKLNDASNIIANHIICNCAGNNIGLVFSRSIEYICSLLGVIKANRVFVPIDKDLPIERIKYIIADAEIEEILCDSTCDELFDVKQWEIESLIQGGELGLLSKNYHVDGTKNPYAYIMYTSGTTGNPKGVQITREGLVNLILSFISRFSKAERYVFISSISFDASIVEIFVSIFSGKRLYIPNRNTILSGNKLYNYLKDNRIELLQTVPVVLVNTLYGKIRLNDLKIIISEGAPIEERLKDELIVKGYEVYNAYGPTEMTVCVSVGKCALNEKVSLGEMIENTYAEVVNEDGTICGEGDEGELITWGMGLSAGYLGESTCSVQRFFDDKGIRKYRTGDIVRIINGHYYYVGRKDNQLKINGCRVDLEEIEAKVQNVVEQVRELKVVYYAQKLILFFTGDILEYEVYNIIKLYLPSFMCPARFMRLDEMPHMISGKIDEKKLINCFEEKIRLEVLEGECHNEIWAEIANVLAIPEKELWENRDKEFEYLGIDSLEFMKIMILFEQKYDFEFDDQDIIDIRNGTIDNLICILKEKVVL